MALGHIQRGGNPTAADILLAVQLGNYACELLTSGESGYIVGMQNAGLIKTPYPRQRIPRTLDLSTNPLVKTARAMGTCFGE